MKVAFLTDYLLGEDKASFMLEVLINMYPDAPILTLAHKPGSNSGPIEQRKIYSTFISHMVKSKEDFVKKSFLVPSALKELPIDEFDFIFCFSRGLSHCFKTRKDQKTLVYIFEWSELFAKYPMGISRLFKPYIDKKRRLVAKKNTVVAYSSEAFAREDLLEGRILPPFFDTSHFLFSEHDDGYYLLDAEGLNKKEVFEFIRAFDYLQLKLTICSDHNFDYASKFIELRPLSDLDKEAPKAKCIIIPRDFEVPFCVLRALSLGKPVLIFDNPFNRGHFQGITESFLKSCSYQDIIDCTLKLEQNIPLIDKKKLRRESLKYNGRIFKARVKNLISEVL